MRELKDILERRPLDAQIIEDGVDQIVKEVRAYRLRELREALGITQAELAEAIGVSQNQVSRLERGDMENSKVTTVRRYLAAIGIDLTLNGNTGRETLLLA